MTATTHQAQQEVELFDAFARPWCAVFLKLRPQPYARSITTSLITPADQANAIVKTASRSGFDAVRGHFVR
ncbi:hypothetical protein X011_20880 [Mycobacterium tuberculosis variant microti OV254]|nr:hypothetical protein X011_20880 [Mycobacterium tuberculosis variant microti OV254]